MLKRLSRSDYVLVCGLVGIAGALLTIVSDLILLGSPSSAYSFLKSGTETMADLAQWRIIAGTYLGIFVLPFEIVGLITLYFGLKPAGKLVSLTVAITAAHALILGVAFHVSYLFIGSGWKLYHSSGLLNTPEYEMIKKLDYYLKIIGFIILVEIMFSSICYTVTIIKKKTLYPKWMSLFNPICVFLIMFPIVFTLPAPVGGFIAPAYMNLSAMVFLILSTATINKRGSYKNLK
jgi:hypothetical protein